MKAKWACAMLCVAMLMSGCRTTGDGALTGAYIGTILGSAIGGLTGGPRGSDAGVLVGMATGAAVGAAVGSANEQTEKEKYAQARAARNSRYSTRTDDSGYDPAGSGDDVIIFDDGSSVEPLSDIAVEVRNVTISGGDGVDGLSQGEQYKVSFEIINNCDYEIKNVLPFIEETSDTKYVNISPSTGVEFISAGTGIRYTATIVGTNKLRTGEVGLVVGVEVDGAEVTSQTQYFTIQTVRN